MITGIAPMKFELNWEGTEQELIDFSDREAKARNGEEFGLDSLDLGDAMGFWITETMLEDCELISYDEVTKQSISCSITFDLFEWKGLKK